MFRYNNKRLLSEGMSLEQIKQGKSPELKGMLDNFVNYVDELEKTTQGVNIKNFINTVLGVSNHVVGSSVTNNALSVYLRSKKMLALRSYSEYILVNVIENGEQLVNVIDINNPTNGVKSKFTDFILRILHSPFFENKTANWPLITDFLKICKTPASKIYQSKNMFFDNVIIPLMDKRVANGEKLGSINPETGIRGANFSRPSPTALLPDKIIKIFDAYGNYNGKNLLQTVMEEIIADNSDQKITTFAGYDTKLIDYCLDKKYWHEFHIPGQPNTIRLFIIGDGDLINLSMSSSISNKNEIDEEMIWDQWAQLDYEEQAHWGDYDGYREFMIAEFAADFLEKDPRQKSFSYYFIARALVYACNIYPFKTTYNVSKGLSKVTSGEIAFYKSLSDDDYIIPKHLPDVKIRKTTDWCTKDEDQLSRYIMPGVHGGDKFEGFVLCLNDSLSFDDPDGALQIGIKMSDRNPEGNSEIRVLNANDHPAQCPDFLNDFLNKYSKTAVLNLLDQVKKNQSNLRNLNFPVDEDLSPEEKKKYFEKMMNSLNERLLRSYIRCLLS